MRTVKSKIQLLLVLTIVFLKSLNAQIPILYYDFEVNSTRSFSTYGNSAYEKTPELSINSGSSAITYSCNGAIDTGGLGAAQYRRNLTTVTDGAAFTTTTSSTFPNWNKNANGIDPGTSTIAYYEFPINTTGFSGISVILDTRAFTNGPDKVGILWSNDGGISWNAAGIFNNTGFGNNAITGWTTDTFNLSNISSLDNNNNVRFRIYGYAGTTVQRTTIGFGTAGVGFQMRIDNLMVLADTLVGTVSLPNYANSVGLGLYSGSSYTPPFGAVIINAPSSTVTLNGDLTLNQTLTLANGILNTSSYTLTIQNCDIPISRTNGTLTVSSTGSLKFGSTGNTSGAAFTLPNNLFTSNPSFNNFEINRDNQLTLGNQPITINGQLLLSLGILNNTSTAINLTTGDTIVCSGGSLTSSLYFGTTVNIIYSYNSLLSYNTGYEVPSDQTIINSIFVNNGPATVTLSIPMSLACTMTLKSGTFDVGTNVLSFYTNNTPLIKTSGTLNVSNSGELQFGYGSNLGGNAFTLPTGLFTNNTVGNLAINRTNSISVGNQDITITDTLVLTNGIFNVSSRILTFQNGNVPIYRTNGTLTISTTGSLQFGTSGNTGGNAFTFPNGLFTSATPKFTNLTINRDSMLSMGNQNIVLNGGALNLVKGVFNVGNQTLTLQVSNIPITRTNGTLTIGSNGSLVFGGTVGLLDGGNAFTFPNGLFTTSPAIFLNLTVQRINALALGDQSITLTGSLILTEGLFDISNDTLTFQTGNTPIASAGAGLLNVANSGVLQFGTTGNTGGAAWTFCTGFSPINNGTISNLIINRTNGIILNNNASGQNITIAGSLNIISGSFSTSTKTITLNGSADVGSNQIIGTGSVVINGLFRTSNVNGFSGASSTSISNTIASLALGTLSTVEYYSSTTQGVTARSYSNLKLSNGQQYLRGNISIGNNDTLTVDSTNNNFNTSNYQITFGTSGIALINGNIQTQGASGFCGGSTTTISSANNPSISFGSLSTVVYNGGSSNQIISPRTDYVNLYTIGSNKSITGNTSIGGSFMVLGDTVTIGSNTLTMNGTDSFSNSGVLIGSITSDIVIGGTGNNFGNLYFAQGAYNNYIRNLTFSRDNGHSVNINTQLNITGTLSVTGGIFNIINHNVTLISNSSGTANVAPITSGGLISGNLTVQRYIPSGIKGWRMMSSPVSGFDYSQLISSIFITGIGGTANGFDYSPISISSLYTYKENTSSSARGWKYATNITNTVSPGIGSLVFIRGDRTITNWYSAPYPTQNSVTFNYQGLLNQGTISPTISYTNTGQAVNDGWNLVGNPYACQIDWNSISKTNLSSFYYVVDPSTGSYVANNGTNFIASGQAFFVHAIGSSPSISFTESCKTTSSPTNYFKTAPQILQAKMILDSVHSDLLWIEFKSRANKGYDNLEDAIKFTNSSINFGLLVNNDSIQLQYNTTPLLTSNSDTFNLFVNAASGNYQLNFSGLSSINSLYSVFLYDSFTRVLQDLKIDPNYPFSISSSPLTSGNNRFKIIMTLSSSLPVTMTSFYSEKSKNNKDVILFWSTASEKSNDHFVIERSIDNDKTFKEIGVVSGNENSISVINYTYTDSDILTRSAKSIYYRLKQIDKDGSPFYSKVISINLLQKEENLIILYPNPALEKLNLQTVSEIEGSAHIDIHDIVGKICLSEDIFLSKRQQVSFDISALPIGIYTIKIVQPSSGKQTVLKFTKQ